MQQNQLKLGQNNAHQAISRETPSLSRRAWQAIKNTAKNLGRYLLVEGLVLATAATIAVGCGGESGKYRFKDGSISKDSSTSNYDDGGMLDSGGIPDSATLDGILDGTLEDAGDAGMKNDMVNVPAGAFWMGCNLAVDTDCLSGDEFPYHEVTLSAYFIDKTEVTVAAYAACVDAGVCQPLRTDRPWDCTWGIVGLENHPANCVDWQKAVGYCTWMGKRLPTEAEWEKAARGTDGRRYPWGNEDPNCSLANFRTGVPGQCVGSTTEVGSYPTGASPYGALDMAGNVMEWVSDRYNYDYYSSSPSTNPQGPASGDGRVLRGGFYDWTPKDIRTSKRHWQPEDVQLDHMGIRCASDL